MPTKPTKAGASNPEHGPRQAPSVSLAVQYAADEAELAGVPDRAKFRRWVRAALGANAVVTVRIVGEAEGSELNARYRRKRRPTNVLSFDFGTADSPAGDIVLCAPVVAREAAAQGKALEAHYAHLTVHGMLHLQGHDHLHDVEANRMERLETAILRRLGFPDPYREGPAQAGA
jgi:probable rRNA maturation factor